MVYHVVRGEIGRKIIVVTFLGCSWPLYKARALIMYKYFHRPYSTQHYIYPDDTLYRQKVCF
jgi:hypothetical protein